MNTAPDLLDRFLDGLADALNAVGQAVSDVWEVVASACRALR